MIHILEPIDPDTPAAGGIKTVIDLIISGVDKDFVLVGVTNNKKLVLGNPYERSINNRSFVYIPIAYAPRSNLKKTIPDSLSFSLALLKFRNRLKLHNAHAHRVEIGFVASLLFWPTIKLNQFVHTQAHGLTSKKSESFWKYLKPVYFQIEKHVLKKSDSVLVFNYSDSKRLAKISNKVTWIQTSYREETFYPKTSESSQVPKLIWVGRFEKTKNPILALEFIKIAHKINPSIEAVFIGDGTLKKDMSFWIDENFMNKEIKIIPPLSPEDLASQLRHGYALLITSWFEGSPTAPLEANACGIPVISTKDADPENYIGNTNGVIISGVDESQVEVALRKVMNLTPQSCIHAAYPRRSSVMLTKIEELSCKDDS